LTAGVSLVNPCTYDDLVAVIVVVDIDGNTGVAGGVEP
jgi:hypothetical protein